MSKQFLNITYLHYFPSIKDNPKRIQHMQAAYIYDFEYLPIQPKKS